MQGSISTAEKRFSLTALFRECSSKEVLACGILCLVSFLIPKELYLELIQMFFFMSLILLRKKRIRMLSLIIIFITITFLHIFQPIGKILFTVKDFPVTLGAVESGIHKAARLMGLIYISQFSISSKLRMPGEVGKLLTLMFLYFERFTENKFRPEGKKFIESIDKHIIMIYGQDVEEPQAEKKDGRKRLFSRLIFLSAIVAFSWAFLIIPGQ